MSTKLNLVFKTSDNRTYTLNIHNPRANITRAEATAVMEAIIAKDVFETGTAARLVGIDNICTVVTTKNEILV